MKTETITYSISDLEHITGISAHTLRKWESRYSFIEPHRTETNIRYYTERHVKKLICVKLLVQNGHRLNHIDKFSPDDFQKAVENVLKANKNSDIIDLLTLSMLEMDEQTFVKVIQIQIIKYGITHTVVHTLFPFLNHVGILWGMNRAMPAQEHFISNLIKQKIFSEIDRLPVPSDPARRLVLFLPPGEDHEISLLLAHYIARSLGWLTYYLGQNVPIDNIISVQEIVKPDLMFTIFINNFNKNAQNTLNEILNRSTTPLWFSSSTLNASEVIESPNLTFLETPSDFIDALNNLE